MSANRQLVVFDIDGTLTLTSQVDDSCYIRAARDEWGVEGMSTDWSEYRHSTDNAIASELFFRRFGRHATSEALAAMRDRFADYVRTMAEREPDLFRPVPGVIGLLRMLPGAGWDVAIATGGWSPSARRKLERAGIPAAGIPAAFACDAWPREAIIRIAVHRAAERAGIATYDRIVYVGDGVWDVRACRRMSLPFLGIAQGERAERLRSEGATAVIPDYQDAAAVIGLLAEVHVPDSAESSPRRLA